MLQLALLWWVRVPLLHQLLLAISTGLLVLSGLPVARYFDGCLPDRITIFVVSYLLSLSALMGLGMLALHRPIFPAAGGATRPLFVTTYVLFLALAMIAWRRAPVVDAATPLARSRWAFAVLASLALGLAALTYFGKLNHYLAERSPDHNRGLLEWGQHSDALQHLIEIPRSIVEEGFPPSKLGHAGLQVLLVQQAQLSSTAPLVEAVIKTAKALSPLFYFAIAYLVFDLSGQLGVPKHLALLAAICSLLFGPISLHPFRSDFTSYAGNVPAAATLYHNATQLFSLPFALAGTLLIASALGDRVDRRYVAGCVLIAASFFIKPSGFSVLAPAAILILPLTQGAERRAALLGASCLAAVPLLWWTYARLFGLTSVATEVGQVFAPFRSKFLVGRHTAPQLLQEHPVWWAVAIILLSLGAFVPMSITGGLAMIRASRSRDHLATLLLRRRREVFLALPALLGVVGSSLLSSAQRGFSNLSWGAATGVIVALPLAFWSLQGASKTLRRVVLLLFALHLWGGIQHLIYFVATGEVIVRTWSRS